MHRLRTVLLGIGSALWLAACGGGGTGNDANTVATTSTVTSATYPLRAAYQAQLAAGESYRFNVGGYCHGEGTATTTPPQAATFDNDTNGVVSTTSTLTLNLYDCTPASVSLTGTNFYSTVNHLYPMGYLDGDGEYGVMISSMNGLPESVQVGDRGKFGIEDIYADSSKSTWIGNNVYSYVIAPGADNAVTASSILQRYNSTNQLVATTEKRYRLSPDGTLTLVSVDEWDNLHPERHLVYLPK